MQYRFQRVSLITTFAISFLAFALIILFSGCGGSSHSTSSSTPTTSSNNPAPGSTNTGSSGGTTSGNSGGTSSTGSSGSGSTNSGGSSGSGSGGGTNSGGTGSSGSGSGTGGSGGSGSGGSGSGGSGTGSSTAITGRVVDGSTGQPIQGTAVIDLEAPAPGDYATLAETKADANGNFSFNNVQSGKAYAIAISAVTNQQYYVPTLIMGGGDGAPGSAGWASATPIGPGTNIGTIGLPLPPAPNSFDISQPVTSQTAGGLATPVTVTFTQRAFIADWVFTIPFVAIAPPSVTTAAGPTCPTNTDCGTADLAVASSPAQYAGFNPNGMTFTTYQGYGLNLLGIATVPGSSTPDCNPNQAENFNFTMTPGSTQTGQSMDFKSCQ